MIVGVDTGGTFTDVIRRDSDGRLHVYKLLSTPDDPSRAIGDGVEAVVGESTGAAGEVDVVHGTTVATNALLERDGGAVAFLTTEGFEDLPVLQRQNRPDLYAFDVRRPAPLVDSGDCFGVDERLRWDGAVLAALDEESLEGLAATLQEDYEAVAICLLHSYADDRHEEAIAEHLSRRAPDLHISASSDVVGVFREYERASTTLVNAYVAPVMGRYLERLESRVDADSIEVMQSNGGRIDVDYAARYPVHTILSGPAGGVVGARAAGREVGIERLISFDMGGTSTDVSLCDGGLEITSEAEIDGLPIRVPVIDIHTVGAGGGSIARVDPGGGLRVGPESAGAEPGPACYDRGGARPTVTDAHVVLGRIRTGHFLGGRMELSPERAEQAVGELAADLGLELRDVARGILEVADSAMIRALKVISLERGHDPREFGLVSFGGAGALHACRLASELDIATVVVPRNPGLMSAYGMLHADYQRMVTRSILRPLDEMLDAPDELADILEQMRSDAVAEVSAPRSEFEARWYAALRYTGQSYEIDVPLDWEPGAGSFSDPRAAFEEEHERLYGYRAEERSVELVGLRLTAARPGIEPGDYRQTSVESSGETRDARTATVGFASGDHEAEILDRRSLADGDQFEGPAVVTEYSGTTAVPPGWRADVQSGHLVLRAPGEST